MKCRSAVASSRRSTCVPADAHWAAASPLPEGELLTFQPCCRSLCGGAPSNRAELSESSPRWYSKTRIFSWSTSATPRRFARARIETFTIAEPGFSGRMPRQTGRTETGDRCRGVEAQGKAATNGSKDRSRHTRVAQASVRQCTQGRSARGEVAGGGSVTSSPLCLPSEGR